MHHSQTSARQTDSSSVSHSDAELLARFLASQDQAAFTSLVERHASLVMGICNRILRDKQDAEDCFQQVFLKLAIKGDSIRETDSLIGWLFTVAHREAIERYQQRARHPSVSLKGEPMEQTSAAEKQDEFESALALQEEVSRLPESYRGPIVLCYLQGKSREETARELDASEASVKARLSRGRKLLQKRLVKRGIVYGAALAAWQSSSTFSAGTISTTLIAQTVTLSTAKATAVSSGLAGSSSLSSYSSGALKLMAMSKTAKIGVAVFALLLLGTGGSLLLMRGATSPDRMVKSPETSQQKEENSPVPISTEVSYPKEFETYEPVHACAAKFLYCLYTENIEQAADFVDFETRKLENRPRPGMTWQDRLAEELQEMSSGLRKNGRDKPLKIKRIFIDEHAGVALTEEALLPVTEENVVTGAIVLNCSLNAENEWKVIGIDLASQNHPSRMLNNFMLGHPDAREYDGELMKFVEEPKAER
ncbi:ECF RNA polymerase sigma factor SigM [Polystyrenella longa]|uniref:ECF RNA polymerase sigma factor SigM n=1 Tax=Polystyrenella longa TaxID=2528007 RepID=A0A518CHM5_9PLAN|nr:RNA polymerase sigma factor [Polystyrenella longa]QDU78727.1 ECF RNA polymerase sigma factor SigM [Polystyrenella longa]